MQICYYVTHKQMYANTSKHNQFRLYNIDLNDIKIQNARCFNVKVSWELKSTSRVEKKLWTQT